MTLDAATLTSLLLPVSGGFVGGGATGFGIGYVLKKIMRIVIGIAKVVVAAFVALFIGGLAVLDYLGVITVNWPRLYALGTTLYTQAASTLTWLQAQIIPLMSYASTVAQTLAGNSLLGSFAVGTLTGLGIGLTKA